MQMTAMVTECTGPVAVRCFFLNRYPSSVPSEWVVSPTVHSKRRQLYTYRYVLVDDARRPCGWTRETGPFDPALLECFRITGAEARRSVDSSRATAPDSRRLTTVSSRSTSVPSGDGRVHFPTDGSSELRQTPLGGRRVNLK